MNALPIGLASSVLPSPVSVLRFNFLLTNARSFVNSDSVYLHNFLKK